MKSIPAAVILYVVNANEPTERLQESKMYLHSLMMESIAADSTLFIIFNVSYIRDNNKDDG